MTSNRQSISPMTPSGRISMPEFHVPKSTNQLAFHQKSQEDYNLQQLGYANKSIPHFRKIPGGESAYEQALMKKGSQTKRPQTSNRMQSNRTDFQTINQHISRNVGLFGSSNTDLNKPAATERQGVNRSNGALKVFKEHLPPESQSIASSLAAEMSGRPQEKLAKVDLAQLVAHRLRSAKKPEDCQSTASVFLRHS